ncbi:MAG: hypothetical protein JO013_07420 [Alphaproteobacteria bacterium]|nr:hypothetical protein [Alphaproteobacteria bacterium]
MPLILAPPEAAAARDRERAALATQIELLEDEWRSGMERDTLILLDHACARLAALDAEERAAMAAAPNDAL